MAVIAVPIVALVILIACVIRVAGWWEQRDHPDMEDWHD